jgi:hypothetical protein
MVDTTRSVQVNLRLPAALKEAAERVAAADHRSLTSLVEKLLAEHTRVKPALDNWHERALTRLIGILSERRVLVSKNALLTRSYSIETRQPEQINPGLLVRNLQRVHADLGNFIPNPEIFYPYTRSEIAPYFTYDPNLTRSIAEEILECVALPEREFQTAEFWRVSPHGLASDVRTFHEDHESFKQFGLDSGKWFSPFLMVRSLYSLTQHAYLFSQKFASSTTVQFRCEWMGLLEREIRDPEHTTEWPPGKMARVDGRVTTGEWPIGDVAMKWPEIVSALGGPVVRLFDPNFDFTADWIRSHMQSVLR